ncbi:hypothetical protein LRAMOSA01412 [Lichtheimia ramosa]|uniref:F-box domain-containing protein n=1 Tax=Lichtheimia ramosa TaxID=688394 RepID=A0A077WK37_9FUNG|nr:hypothetical protein LRAMOSA01412 [Lichtheimia ramosa]
MDIEFYDTQVSVQQSFFALLSKLAIHALREIAFLRHRGVLDFFKVVAVCPQLTVFDFSASGDQGELEAYSMPTRSKITHMCLNGRPYDIHPQLELILRQCPHLRFLATNNPWIRAQENMDKLLQYCPKIEYFEYARHTRHARHYRHQHIQRLPLSNDQDGCLRELVLDGYRSGNMPDTHMLTSLEILRLKTTLIRDVAPFSQVLDRLCVLSCDQVLCDPPGILASLIQQCPSLEEVSLRGFPLVPDICEALCNVSRLKRLYLFRNNHMRPGEGNILWPLLQSLHQRPLQCLQLEGILNDHLIEPLTLPGNNIHPQLTQLSISSKYLTSGALDWFIIRSTSAILSMVKTLTICDIKMVSRTTLAALGDLDHLEHLVLRRCRHVDGDGINDLLCHTKSLRSLFIMHCDISNASKEKIRQAIHKLGKDSVLYIPWRFASLNVKDDER